MLVRDILLEKAVNPGERKAIQLKIDDYKKKMNQVLTFKDQAYAMDNSEHPPGMQEKIAELVVAYREAIKKLQAELEATNDEDSEGVSLRLKKLMAGIQKNCSESVAYYKKAGQFLYRGTNESAEAFFGKPFDERVAKDSNQEFSDALNWAMAQKGIEARRDNSIFTGTAYQASNYGKKVYIVFPVNGFKFSWSTAFDDLVIDSGKARNMLDEKKVNELYDTLAANPDLLNDFVSNTFIDDSAKQFVMTEYGFMGRSNFTRQWNYIKELAKKGKLGDLGQSIDVRGFKALVDPDAAIRYFQIREDDFEAAIRANTEVVIRGAYYAVRKDLESSVKNILGMRSYY